MSETVNGQAEQVGDLLGQIVTFDGEYMGTVVEDRVRPVCWHLRPQRVLTLDNGHKPNELRLTRRFDATPERVFAAWLDPGAVQQWLFATSSGHPVVIDARAGGSCIIPNWWGGVEVVIAYLEIAPPRRLVFDLTLPYFSPDSDRLTVEIAPAGAGCVLALIHEGPPPDYQSPIERGWAGMFDDLASTLGQLVLAPEESGKPDGVRRDQKTNGRVLAGRAWDERPESSGALL